MLHLLTHAHIRSWNIDFIFHWDWWCDFSVHKLAVRLEIAPSKMTHRMLCRERERSRKNSHLQSIIIDCISILKLWRFWQCKQIEIDRWCLFWALTMHQNLHCIPRIHAMQKWMHFSSDNIWLARLNLEKQIESVAFVFVFRQPSTSLCHSWHSFDYSALFAVSRFQLVRLWIPFNWLLLLIFLCLIFCITSAKNGWNIWHSTVFRIQTF